HRRDPGGHVVDEVAVDVPPVVEVPGKRPPGGLGDLALAADGALAVSTQLQDVDVRAEVEEVLDELAAGPGVTVLGEAVHQEQRLGSQGLPEARLAGPVTGDAERPPVLCLGLILRLVVQLAEANLIHRGEAALEAKRGGVRGKSHTAAKL